MTTVYVRGRPHEFPPETSQEEIRAILQQKYPAASDTPITDSPMDPSWLDRISGAMEESQLQIQDTLAEQTGLAEFERIAVGDPAQRRLVPVMEPTTRYTGTLIRTLFAPLEQGAYELVQEADELLEGELSKGWDSFMQSNVGQALGVAFQAGGEQWNNFTRKHPQTARTFQDWFETMTLGYKGPQERVISQFLAPPDKIGNVGQTGERPVTRKRTYTPTAKEVDVAREVSRAPGFDVNRSYAYNLNRVDSEIVNKAKRLNRDILRTGNPQMDLTSIKDQLRATVVNFDALDDAIGLSDGAKNTAKQILTRAEHLINQSDGTAFGILNVRRELDQWVNARFGSRAFDADAVNGQVVANKVLRSQLNQAVIDAVPDVNVKESLRAQSRLYEGRDSVLTHLPNEAQGPVSRFIQNTLGEGHVGPVGAMAIGGSLGGILGKITTDTVGVGGAAGVSMAAFYQVLKSHERRRVLGAALQFVNQELESSPENDQLHKDKEILRQMLEAESG